MNSTKIEILRCLSDGQWRTSPQVALECGLSLTNASELLRRYHAQSLLVRVRNPGVPRGYLYALTDVGLERLRYLSSDGTQASLSMADNVGLTGKKKRIFDQWVKQKIGGKEHG